jgi:signal transduction histidine kinase
LHHTANYVLEHSKSNAEQKKIDLACSISETMFVNADYDMLLAVFRNLISNAIKYTNSGGEIRVNAQENGDFVEVAVIDNGVGMPAERIERLFKVGEKRMSTSGTAGEKGTGLGLILCKEFVERHGGQIWVESEKGQGSTIKFTVPVGESVTG